MLRKIAFACLLSSLATAQTVFTVGGTSSAPARSNLGKGNLFAVDQTSLLIDIEMFLDVPGVETLTFFIYRSPTRGGPANLEFTNNVTVNGTGVGPAFYSSGPLMYPLVCGNAYVIGASWPGTVTYHYDRGTTGSVVPIGTWERGNTTGHPPGMTEAIAGVDVAQYHQRLSVLTLQNVVNCVGSGCSGSGGTAPKLVASDLPRIGTQFTLDLVEGRPSTSALFALAIGPAATTPTPLFGCLLWLDPRAPLFGITTRTSNTGVAQLALTVPNDFNLVGFPLSAQAAVTGAPFDLTNGVNLSVVN